MPVAPEDIGISTTDEQILERFSGEYLCDMGIQVQILEAINSNLFNQPNSESDLPITLFRQAMADITGDDGFHRERGYALELVVNAAASLEFLVRHARKVDPRVMPPEVIPTDEVVNAVLAAFHNNIASQ